VHTMSHDEVRSEVMRQFREKWARTRLRGRNRFVLVTGVITWGGLMAFGLILGQYFSGKFDFLVAAGTIIFFGVGGYIVGSAAWKQHEKEFLGTEMTAKLDENTPPRNGSP
jgi:hypothetical protein